MRGKKMKCNYCGSEGASIQGNDLFSASVCDKPRCQQEFHCIFDGELEVADRLEARLEMEKE